MRKVIVQSDLSADQIRAKLGDGCKETDGSARDRNWRKVLRSPLPFALVEALANGQETVSLEKQLERQLGGETKVFRNRLKQANVIKTVQLGVSTGRMNGISSHPSSIA